ncbi:MAG: tetratricopeptide repeat protein [SAR202 cluster bacterium]|jgi:tetratricopeptide (TPR) repeat protein|nr:hypothetical protein [Chloroflexota bacterium]MDP6422910.1 tetratricopeptide repeat protein [SAR202 cluster bacterium]HAL46930.1 hypothetical protein [Dehalococcoidia bacterium]MDP6665488.1 tetratricopeptide repeat protein [SAR202 cluster bacterium]MDP6798282.1 tetratricopeptide repeat protein [SAR202 cluster bacterium]|tara:strand:- start:10453 stop:11253 length:801 start_codon:yes stop_codon:yes gene_type:complete
MKAAVALLLVMLFVAFVDATTAAADAPGDLDAFAAANGLYDDGAYAEAARSYERLSALGYEDASIYYNLGNTYHKQGDIGRAILNYLRAKRLSPRDEDLTANLDLVRTQTVDLMESTGSRGALADLAGALPELSANELAATALALWAAVMGGVAAATIGPVGRSRRIAVSVAVGASVLLAFTALTMAGRSRIDAELDSTAVILDESVQVHSGPGVQYATEFEIHAGAETELLEVRDAWARISIAAPELQGWVPNTTLETVLLSAIP